MFTSDKPYRQKINWRTIEAAARCGEGTQEELATRFNVPLSTLQKRWWKGKWSDSRKNGKALAQSAAKEVESSLEMNLMERSRAQGAELAERIAEQAAEYRVSISKEIPKLLEKTLERFYRGGDAKDSYFNMKSIGEVDVIARRTFGLDQQSGQEVMIQITVLEERDRQPVETEGRTIDV